MRTIDADALMKKIESIDWYSKAKNGVLVCGAKNEKESFLPTYKVWEAVKQSPTVEDIAVRHGRWIEGGYACGESEWECSECHEIEWRTSASQLKFCPFCGARMDADTAT